MVEIVFFFLNKMEALKQYMVEFEEDRMMKAKTYTPDCIIERCRYGSIAHALFSVEAKHMFYSVFQQRCHSQLCDALAYLTYLSFLAISERSIYDSARLRYLDRFLRPSIDEHPMLFLRLLLLHSSLSHIRSICRPAMVISHDDEDTFSVNERKRKAWTKKGEIILMHKSRGQAFRISELCFPFGQLSLEPLKLEKKAEVLGNSGTTQTEAHNLVL